MIAAPWPGVVCCRKTPVCAARASVVNFTSRNFSAVIIVNAAETLRSSVGLRVAVTCISSIASGSLYCAESGKENRAPDTTSAVINVFLIKRYLGCDLS